MRPTRSSRRCEPGPGWSARTGHRRGRSAAWPPQPRGSRQAVLEGHLACFREDYRSEQPAHPARTFSGSEQVRENWSKLYASISDFRAELLRLAVVGDEEWGEWIWRRTKEDG